jgi:hypothetical protein
MKSFKQHINEKYDSGMKGADFKKGDFVQIMSSHSTHPGAIGTVLKIGGDAIQIKHTYQNQKKASYSASVLNKLSKQEYKKIDKKQDSRSMSEGKQDYQLYHDTYTSAVYAALAYATENGYEHDPEEAASEIGMGPRKPSKGKTNSITLPLYKKDKVQKKALHFQVYNRGVSRNTYELNAYIS